jgi:acetyl-CoA C-acetyltransferase
MHEDVYLAGGVRTPIGAFCGALAEVPAPRLGAIAVKASLARSGAPPESVHEVVMGNVVSAGLGQNVARQCSLGAGLSNAVGATTVNRVCGSGLKAVMMAAQAIQLGEAGVIVAGGTESMSRAPYLLERARGGYRMGNGELVDSMIRDGLWDVYNQCHMGTCGDATARKLELSRAAQDEYAVRSFRRAIEAAEKGWTAAEIVAVDIECKKGTTVVERDEGPSRFNEEKLRKLPPAFGADGTVTAGNASSINDGASAITVLSKAMLRELKVKPTARILGYSTFSREPEWFTVAPIDVNRRLLKSLGLDASKVDVFEINEAFAVVPMAVMKELSLPAEKVNPLGGAIALGHPIGASGCRTLVTMLNALRVRKQKIGIVSLCVGGGEAVAMAVELCAESH